jgi:hypothetical protein
MLLSDATNVRQVEALLLPMARTRKLASNIEAPHCGCATVRHVYGIGARVERQAVRHLQLALQWQATLQFGLLQLLDERSAHPGL